MKCVKTCAHVVACLSLVGTLCHGSVSFGQATRQGLQVKVDPADGSYALGAPDAGSPVLKAAIAIQFGDHWLRSKDYPRHTITTSRVADDLGDADQWTVTFSGLAGSPDIAYQLRAYPDLPFADIQAFVHNTTTESMHISSIRSIDAFGKPLLDLGDSALDDRVLSDSYSEGPGLAILDLADARHQMHRGVGSQLIYNRQTHRSLFVGALTSDNFLTVLRIHIAKAAAQSEIAAYEVDSTGTTELQKENALRKLPPEDQLELQMAVHPGEELRSERVLLGIGSDYHRQLETYGSLIRQLHHARVSAPVPMGWWSWTAYYFGLNEGTALTNAQFLAQHLTPLGYDFFHIDEGYQYARGEYTTPNAAVFPHGMASVEHKISALGLTTGIWTAPFQVSSRSEVYEDHPDWLVHDATGNPLPSSWIGNTNEKLFVLDSTNPGAQAYLRKTYKTLTDGWGVRYIKLDFMDDSAIEGYHYRPNTSALEAQRIGLQIIRQAVGDDVLLDKDGSMMLNPVGYVDFGRISVDTGHSFEHSRHAAPGIAARYYMNRNFFVADPDAFSLSTQNLNNQFVPKGRPPLTLDEAKVSISLAAISGGMYEIGDDLPLLGSEAERLALVENKDLITMARLGKACTPVDLMTYLPEDEQPSIFLLRESARQTILTIFDWTNRPRTHTIPLATLGLHGAAPYEVFDVLDKTRLPAKHGSSLTVSQPAHSVRVLRIVDMSVSPKAPVVSIQHSVSAPAGETMVFSADDAGSATPAITYQWVMGDGVTLEGPRVTHAYTHAGDYQVRLTAAGPDALVSTNSFSVTITGSIPTAFVPLDNRRYKDDQ